MGKRQISAKITLGICAVLGVVLILLLITLPWVWQWLIWFFDREKEYFAVTLAFVYPVCVLAEAAVAMMTALLVRVLCGQVFSRISVRLIGGIAGCCFAACPLLCAVGYWYCSMFVVAFAAAFVGFALSVVKNVIGQATEIKAENDLTV